MTGTFHLDFAQFAAVALLTPRQRARMPSLPEPWGGEVEQLDYRRDVEESARCARCLTWPEIVVFWPEADAEDGHPPPDPRHVAGCACGYTPMRINVIHEVQPIR